MNEINDTEFKTVIKGRSVVILFGGDHCAACKAVEPVVGATCALYKVPFYKMDVGGSGVAMQYSIRALPTLILFKDGKEAERLIGAFKRQQLLDVMFKTV